MYKNKSILYRYICNKYIFIIYNSFKTCLIFKVSLINKSIKIKYFILNE